MATMLEHRVSTAHSVAAVFVMFVAVAGLFTLRASLVRAQTLPPPVICPTCWVPPLVTSWQWQLDGRVDESVQATLYDVDMFDNDAALVARLHAQGRKVICYIDVGSWENWRPDKDSFPAEVLGKMYQGFRDERWLDIRRLDSLGPILGARLDQCAAKGFDGAEPDNLEGYQNDTGFPLTFADQLAFNVWIANAAHSRGLNVALKNDGDQVADLLPYFDWALVEQCVQYDFCDQFVPFTQAGKAVMAAEYRGGTRRVCPVLNALNFNGIRKRVNLKKRRVPCR